MSGSAPGWRPALAWLFILALIVLHHDFWQWDRAEPILFGWAPLALWYHMSFTALAIPALYLLGRWAWPDPPSMPPAGMSEGGAGGSLIEPSEDNGNSEDSSASGEGSAGSAGPDSGGRR